MRSRVRTVQIPAGGEDARSTLPRALAITCGCLLVFAMGAAVALVAPLDAKSLLTGKGQVHDAWLAALGDVVRKQEEMHREIAKLSASDRAGARQEEMHKELVHLIASTGKGVPDQPQQQQEEPAQDTSHQHRQMQQTRLRQSRAGRRLGRGHPSGEIRRQQPLQGAGSELAVLNHMSSYPPRLFQAQAGQDRHMYQHYFQKRPELKDNGIFVEFGARDGVAHSNTYFFENGLGWKGIMAEADVREYPPLPGNRPGTIPIFGALTSEDGSTIDFLVSKHLGWSGFADEYNKFRLDHQACPCATVKVPTYRLNTVLDRCEWEEAPSLPTFPPHLIPESPCCSALG